MTSTWLDIDDLSAWLEPGKHEHIAIVGGGGKTTTLFSLGAQLGGRIVMTTTTKMGSDRTEGHVVILDPSDDALAQHLDEHERVLVWASRGSHRAEGVAPEDCDRWFERRLADHVIIEADGSRRRPFKAPYPYEPVIPSSATIVVACIGAGALGKQIGEVCHRPDAVVEIIGGTSSDPLHVDAAARVLRSDAGSRKGLPEGARFVVLAHRADCVEAAMIDDLAAALDGVEFAAVRSVV